MIKLYNYIGETNIVDSSNNTDMSLYNLNMLNNYTEGNIKIFDGSNNYHDFRSKIKQSGHRVNEYVDEGQFFDLAVVKRQVYPNYKTVDIEELAKKDLRTIMIFNYMDCDDLIDQLSSNFANNCEIIGVQYIFSNRYKVIYNEILNNPGMDMDEYLIYLMLKTNYKGDTILCILEQYFDTRLNNYKHFDMIIHDVKQQINKKD